MTETERRPSTPSPPGQSSAAALASRAAPGSAARMRARQSALIDRYREQPEAARVTEEAETRSGNHDSHGPLDPLHTWVTPGRDHGISVPVGVPRALGGLSDLPSPGDLLCAALASCTDATIRVLANAVGLPLQELAVRAHAEADARGVLCVTPDARVGLERIALDIDLRAAPGVERERVDRLLELVDHCCMVLRTLRNGVPVHIQQTVRSNDPTPGHDRPRASLRPSVASSDEHATGGDTHETHPHDMENSR